MIQKLETNISSDKKSKKYQYEYENQNLFFIYSYSNANFVIFDISTVPQKVSYQSIIRNTSGELVKSSVVGLRVSIVQGTVDGMAVYTETHTPPQISMAWQLLKWEQEPPEVIFQQSTGAIAQIFLKLKSILLGAPPIQ
jgi:hypothetical protein